MVCSSSMHHVLTRLWDLNQSCLIVDFVCNLQYFIRTTLYTGVVRYESQVCVASSHAYHGWYAGPEFCVGVILALR